MHNMIAKKLLTENSLELKDLEGLHRLSGVERIASRSVEAYSSDANGIVLVLDGVPFTFIEDPDDGYRSMFDRIEVGTGFVNNIFDPILVEVTYVKNENEFEGIYLNQEGEKGRDKAIAIIGTDYIDDYYPSFVDEWHPERIKK